MLKSIEENQDDFETISDDLFPILKAFYRRGRIVNLDIIKICILFL